MSDINKTNPENTEIIRDNKGRFEKGNTGNKNGGRPKTPEAFKQLARENSLDALQTTIDIMKNDKAKHADRIKAAEIVMNRAWGLPTQAITGGTDENGNDKAINIETIARLLWGQK